MAADQELDDTDRLVLSDLLTRVLDKGVVISGEVTISVADIDLLRLGLQLVLSGTETELQFQSRTEAAPSARDADPPLLPPQH